MIAIVREHGRAPHSRFGYAEFSPDRRYRFLLRRTWPPSLLHSRPSHLVWIGCNPSTAGATADDQTVAKIAGFTERENCHRFDLVNAFAMIATDPAELLTADDPAGGPVNDEIIARAVTADRVTVVVAWGTLAAPLIPRAKEVLTLLAGLDVHPFVIGPSTRDGHPRHPSRAAYELGLRPARLSSEQ